MTRLRLVLVAGIFAAALALTQRAGSASDRMDEPARSRLEAGSTFANDFGMAFARVERGTFWMGSPEREAQRDASDEQQREATIGHDFYLGAHEVTQRQWERLMGHNPSHYSRSGGGRDAVKNLSDADLARLPVDRVSWRDVQEFLARLNATDQRRPRGWSYRLPTEAEREYALRGGRSSARVEGKKTAPFYFEKPTFSLSSKEANFDGNAPYGDGAKGPSLTRPAVVGSYRANGLGIYDLHGNVREWCDNVSVPGGPERVVRGGDWSDGSNRCRAAFRGWNPPDFTDSKLGFRVALVPAGP